MEIRQLIDQGFTIVTPTRRLGRALQLQYTNDQIAAGEKVWETPDILPWSAWLLRSWDDFATQQDDLPLLLNTQQCQWVWQQIISQSSFAENLLQPAAAANKAYEAWKILRQWQLEVFPKVLWLNKDAFAFQSWVKTFQKQCQEHGWLDIASLEGELHKSVDKWSQSSAAKLALIGFDELTPAQENLLEAMQAAGSEIQHVKESDNKQAEIISTRYADNKHELKAIAHWLRNELKANPNASIGVVIPEMESQLSDIENIFDDVLVPGNLFCTDGEVHNNRPYNLSLGKPLADYPVIHTAFNILNLEGKTVPLEDLGALLRSPFIAGAETEMEARAQLDAELREQGEPEIFLNILQQRLEKDESWPERCPQLITALKQWREITQSLHQKQSCAEWNKSFIQILNAFGWPGERQTQGDEHQTIEAWRELLNQFASLQLITGDVSYHAALKQLRNMAREQTFQVETGEVPIQVLGLLEAAGMQFDKLWIMGLHEENWPAPARANPFIPIKFQREQKLPHASAERELEYARGITDRLLTSAQQVIISTPLSDAGRELRPSPLFKQYPVTQLNIGSDINYAAEIFASQSLEHFNDEQATKVEDAQARGGTGLFKDQAACPFRAFAKHRLGAYGLAEAEIGLSPMERGQLVHDCLQLFWEKTVSHEALQELSEGGLALAINECTNKVTKRFQAARPFIATERFMAIEQGRLKKMMHEWLSLERERAPFTVKETEQKHACVIKGLRINTRLDRLDELPDGSLVVIDYKTGKVNFASWMDERPDDPQLPLYAVTGDGHISAVVFAQIRRGEMKFIGLADNQKDDDSGLPNVKTLSKSRINKQYDDWQALFQFWQSNLETLAVNFMKGDAEVDPFKANTCDYCDLGTFCRINELVEGIQE